jgi:hypothetical protein
MQEKTRYFKLPNSDKVFLAPGYTAEVYLRNGFTECDAKGNPLKGKETAGEKTAGGAGE